MNLVCNVEYHSQQQQQQPKLKSGNVENKLISIFRAFWHWTRIAVYSISLRPTKLILWILKRQLS